MNNTLKWFHVITKTIVHCLLGTIEYIGIPFLLACLSTFISPISSGNTLWLWIERIAFCFTIYEVIIVGVRKMQIDIRKDALLALKTAYERAALYCETGNQDIYRNLTSKIDQVLDNGIQINLMLCRAIKISSSTWTAKILLESNMRLSIFSTPLKQIISYGTIPCSCGYLRGEQA